ncbi:MAG: nucleotidyltransferase family protein [Gammaproteobacteria bacterium]|nr:nucleotidyltransferase family protein [Gammaproteobacteria bacterium]
MNAMILAAGRGERLRPLTDRIPKPLLPIAGEALIVHQLRWLHRAGITEIVVNLHHLGAQIERRVGNGRDLGVNVRYSREEALLDTGGGVRAALPMLGPAPFLVLNGDIWTNYPFDRLVDLVPAAGHLVLTPKPAHRETADFALADGRVRRNGDDGDDLVFTGIAVINSALFDAAPEGPFNIAHALYFEAAKAGRLTGERFHGTWFDIGSPAQLKAVRRLTD